MREPAFRTRITDLFGIRHPILFGGLMWLSEARYVAASVNAGCMGFITARSCPSLEAFRAELERCAELTGGKPFGVNLTVSRRGMQNSTLPDFLRAAFDHGVRHFETAGASPGDLIDAVHAGGGIVVHKASQIRHARSAERAGADAVALVGMEEGGHPGMNELSAMTMGAYAVERIGVPLVIGGGIGSGRQILAALALGADAVVMGTRFLVSEEIWAHEAYKRHLLTRDEESSVRLLRSLRDTWRVLANGTAREVARIESAGARTHEDFGELIKGSYTREHCYVRGDFDKGMLSVGPAVGFANEIASVEAIVDGLIDDALAHQARLDALAAAARARSGERDRPAAA